MGKISIIGMAIVIVFSICSSFVEGGSPIPGDNVNVANVFSGLVCFKYKRFSDTWVLRFDRAGDIYHVVGYDIAYPAAMDGGGAIDPKGGRVLLLTIDERAYYEYGSGAFGEHNIVLDTTQNPLKGKDHLAWFDIHGDLLVSYPTGLSFTQVTCPKPGQREQGLLSASK